ncbi:hypothetical protein G6F59_016064 [Rhizopus arrhizus]|nr:hypothetical protein G6F59_016064 [Rhizopus arrhizus]
MEKVHLTREKATLLITLYAKAEESRLPGSLLQDHYAACAVARIDHDFAALGMRRDEMIGLAMRAYTLDAWVREFLAAHRGATVLHLGCGLDSRVFRVAAEPDVNWFDVDFPEAGLGGGGRVIPVHARGRSAAVATHRGHAIPLGRDRLRCL